MSGWLFWGRLQKQIFVLRTVKFSVRGRNSEVRNKLNFYFGTLAALVIWDRIMPVATAAFKDSAWPILGMVI